MSRKKKNRPEPETLGLPRVGIDSHAHVDSEHFAEPGEIGAVLDKAAAAGVARIGNVFLGPDAYDRDRKLFDDRPELFFLLAVHPNETGGLTDADMARMEARFRSDPRLMAVGETGLDYYWKDVERGVQIAAFLKHLELARGLGLPPVIHSRDSDGDAVRILEDAGFRGEPVLWHCFGGDWTLARRILDNGWHLSIPGPVSYPANAALREAVACIPLDRLLLETDCPYLTPEPWRGKKNQPALLPFTARTVAEAKGLETEEVWQATADNAAAFFGLEPLDA